MGDSMGEGSIEGSFEGSISVDDGGVGGALGSFSLNGGLSFLAAAAGNAVGECMVVGGAEGLVSVIRQVVIHGQHSPKSHSAHNAERRHCPGSAPRQCQSQGFALNLYFMDIYGKETRANIAASSVLVVGAGGIGCELLKNLVLGGFTALTVVDLDVIDLSNLNRQFLFAKQHIGSPKATVAAAQV